MKKGLLVLFAAMGIQCAFAQNSNAPFNFNFIPPSPNAANLGKFGEVPVSMYTGIPEITVPIYAYRSAANDFSLNISLNYHAGGIRVEDIASPIGLGWIASAGGVISRTVRSLPDDLPNVGYLNLGAQQDPTDYIEQERYVKNAMDGEQDVFSFNCPAGSGKFILDQNAQPILINHRKIRIQSVRQPDGIIRAFWLTDEQGIKYLFSEEEKTVASLSTLISTQAYTSSWYLTKMYNPFTRDSIKFVYEGYTTAYNSFNSETGQNEILWRQGNEEVASPPVIAISQFQSEMHGLRCKKIRFPDYVEVEFLYNTVGRCDLKGDHALTAIKINNLFSGISRQYILYHSYYGSFSGTSTPYSPAPCNLSSPAHSLNLRLRMDSLVEVVNTDRKKPYVFQYFDQYLLPPRDSKSQDHWGFFNNAQNTMLIPRVTYNNKIVPGAERNPDSNAAKANSLQKVIYPTGGYSQFDMEINRAGDENFVDSFERETLITPGQVFFDSGYYNFNINRKYEYKPLDAKFTMSDFCAPVGCSFTFSITNTAGNVTYAAVTFDQTEVNPISSKTATIPSILNGQYKLTWSTSAPHACSCGDNIFSLSVTWKEFIRDTLQLTGGLRVKRIINHDGINAANNTITEYTYLLPNGKGSGRTALRTNYAYTTTRERVEQDPEGNTTFVVTDKFLCRTTTTNFPLTYAFGAPVIYERVEEKNIGPNNNGRTIYSFSGYSEFLPFGSSLVDFGNPPFTPLVVPEWAIGNLKSKETYNSNNILIKREVSQWADFIDFLDTLKNLKVALIAEKALGQPNQYREGDYSWIRGRSQRMETIVTEFLGTDSMTVKTFYQYHPNYYLLQKTTTVSSKGDTLEHQTYYPFNYSIPGVLKNMVDSNMIATPVSEEIWLKNGIEKLTKANATEYSWINGLIVPKKQFHLRSTQPIPRAEIGSFNNSVLLRDVGKYELKTHIIQYDSKKNPLEIETPNLLTSYLWDYQNKQPIAAVSNGSISAIAYTSFEADGIGNWNFTDTARNRSFAITGKKSYELVSGKTIIKSNLPTGTQYIVSYWSRNGAASVNGIAAISGLTKNGWTYYEHLLPNNTTSVTLSGVNKIIDELRLFPKGAQMITYTYDTLIGVSSQCDARNNIVYYEYDGFDRLLRMRDIDGNIIKQFRYQYQAVANGNN